MVRLGNFKKLELISPSGKPYIFDDDIETVFLSIEDDGKTVKIHINPDESEFEEEIIWELKMMLN